MKVIKINENQVKCIINKEDIVSRDTNLIELFHNREKMHNLFADMMKEVQKEHGEDYQAEGILMEAMVTFDGSIVVTLTKQDNSVEAKDLNKEKKNSPYIVYSFDTLPMVMEASSFLKNYDGKNSLYKNSIYDRYYLVFSNELEEYGTHKRIYFLNDYGKKENLTSISLSHIMEHSKLLLEESAVQTLGKIS